MAERLTTNQEVPGSTPGWIAFFYIFLLLYIFSITFCFLNITGFAIILFFLSPTVSSNKAFIVIPDSRGTVHPGVSTSFE